MSDAPVNDPVATPPTHLAVGAPQRSTGAVLALLGGLVGLILFAVLAVVLIKNSGSDGSSDGIEGGIRANRIQAVYLTDGQVLFGDVEVGDGEWMKLSNGYRLRRSDTAAKEGAAPKDSSLEVVSIAGDTGGDGDRLINANEVIAIENLIADSPIAQRIEDARK